MMELMARGLGLIVMAGCGFSIAPSQPAGSDAAADGPSPTDAVDAVPDAPPDAAIDARICPAAPSDCVAFSCPTSPSCYYVCGGTTARLDWNESRTRCGTGLGCLATINDAAEQACLTSATAPVFPDVVWFGFRQASNGSEPAGGWGWECGASTFLAGNWGQFEPNNGGGNEDCGVMSTGGAWLDGGCSSESRYVCELP